MKTPRTSVCGHICCLQCLSLLHKKRGGDWVLCLACSQVSQEEDIRINNQLGWLVSKVKALEPQLRTILQMNPRIRKFHVDMTFDPDRANNYLILSED